MVGFWRRHGILALWLVVLAVGLAALLLRPRGAAGEDAPPTFDQLAQQGRLLAERLCQGCHVIGDTGSAVATAGVPSFRGIANRPGQSGEHIRNVLMAPHAPMPDVQASNTEIDRLLAYLESLRSGPAGPSLFPRVKVSPKVQYPDPAL